MIDYNSLTKDIAGLPFNEREKSELRSLVRRCLNASGSHLDETMIHVLGILDSKADYDTMALQLAAMLTE